MMQTELPSHADAIFGTVGGLWTKQRSQDEYVITKLRRVIMPHQGEPVDYCPFEKKEKKFWLDSRLTRD